MAQKITGVRDLLLGALSDYRQNWQKFASLLLAPLLLSYLMGPVSYVLTDGVKPVWPWPLILIAAVISVIIFVAVAVLYAIAYISEFLLLNDLSQAVDFSNLRQWYGRAKPYFWPIVAITLVYTLLSAIGIILLVIPGVIFMVFYCFAVYAAIFEGRKFEGSFGRSRELVRGYWWPVFGRFIAVGAIIYLAYAVIGGLFSGIVWLIALALGLSSSKELFSLLFDLLSVFVGLVVGPLTLIYTYRIYQALKGVKDNLTINN